MVQVGALSSLGHDFIVPGIETIDAVASQGTPRNSAQPSANVSQLIQLHGAGFVAEPFVAGSTVTYPNSVNGAIGRVEKAFFSVSPDGTSGVVSVPPDAVTGHWTLTGGVGPAVPLQIVPTVTRLMLPSGETLRAGVELTIVGSGFKAGATTVQFPGVATPVASTGVANSFGEMRLTVPVPAGITAGQITVATDGGTSNGIAVPVLQSLTASAVRGIPANAAVASANTGQALQLNGIGLSNSTTFVNVPIVNDLGALTTAVITPSIGPDGTTAFIAVPQRAVTGQITISGLGSAPLQIVPAVFSITFPSGQDYVPGVVATLDGSGFRVGSMVTFTGAAPVQATTVSNTPNGTRLTVTVPPGAVNGPVTVTVDGNIGVFDPVAPRVTVVIPVHGRSNIPLNSRVALLFSKPIKRETVTTNTVRLDGPSGQVPGTVSVATDGRSAVFVPTQALVAESAYAVTYTSFIADIAGNSLANAGSSSFTTGTATDTTPPSVSVMSPVNDATAVPTNSLIRLYMSEVLLPTTVDPQIVQVMHGGVPVPVTTAIEQNGTVIRLQPAISLLANTAYTVTLGAGVADLAGNALSSPFSSGFTTGVGPDTTPPTVASVIPSDGQSNVLRDTSIQVTFSEPIEPATVNSTATFTLTGGGITGTISGAFSFSPDRKAVTFIPTFPLLAGQTYFVTLAGIEDVSGNLLVETISSFSTEGGTGGGVVPSIAAVIPAPNALFANGQTITRVTIDNIADSNGFLVPDGTQIAVTAAPVFQQTSVGGTILGGTVSAADSRFKIFTTTNGRVRFDYQSPAVVLAPGFSAEGIIQVADVTNTGVPVSMIGNGPVTLVTSQTATFSFNPQTLLPNGTSQAEITVVVRDPINTLDDFGRPIPAGTTMGVGVLSPSGSLGTLNGGTVSPDPRYKLFGAKTGGILELTYRAPNLVQGPTEGASDEISILAVDPAGNLVGQVGSGFLGYFTGGCAFEECVPGGFTGPLPKLLAIAPAQGESNVGTMVPIVAQFSQSLDPTSVTAATFAVTNGSTPIPGAYTLSAGPFGPNTVVTFVPTAPWTPDTVVVATLTTGIKNTAGNPLLTSAFTIFTVGAGPDTTGPAVVQASLRNGLTNVPHNPVINVQFDQPVNAITLNTNTVTVSAGGTPIGGRISLSNNGFVANGVQTIATFIPDHLLAGDTLYTLAVTNGVTDSSGNPLTAPFTSTFRTAVGTPVTDVGQPSVESTSPPNGQQEAPLNSTIAVYMDKAINPLTIPESFRTPTASQGAITVSPDQRGWSFFPSAPLAPNRGYSFQVTNGLRDIAGNRLSSAFRSDFGTGTALANPAGPQVTSVVPENNATNVFLNQPIKIRFSEPVAAPTVTNQSIVVTRGGVPVNGSITLLDNNRTIQWVPANSGTLASNALHTITITTAVTGLANNPLATQVILNFTTGTATDTTAPTVTNITPLDGAQEVPRNQQIQVTFNEPIDPGSAQRGFFLEHNDSGAEIAGALTLSQDRTTIQFVPTFPLMAGQAFSMYLSGITDFVGNPLAFTSSAFTTAVATGTILSNVPDSANVSSSQTTLTANGQQTTVITITGVSRGGVPVPDGTLIGVTTYPAFNGNSFPGTLLGGTPSGTDSRFVLYSVVGGAVTLTYQTPSLPSGTNLESWVQAAGVDAAGAPMSMIGQRRLRLIGTGGGQ
jgi:hypothetical protein